MNDDLKDKYSTYSTDNNERKNKNNLKIITEVNNTKTENQDNNKEIRNIDEPFVEYKTECEDLGIDNNINVNQNSQKKKINLNLTLLKFMTQKIKEGKSQNTYRDRKENEDKKIDNNANMSERLNTINYFEKKDKENKKNLDEEKKNKLLKIINAKKFNRFQRNIDKNDNKKKLNKKEDINKDKNDNNNRNKEEPKDKIKESNKNEHININKVTVTEHNKKKEYPNNIKTKIKPPISNAKERSSSIKRDALELLDLLKKKKKEEKENIQKKDEKYEDINNKKNKEKITDNGHDDKGYNEKRHSYKLRPRKKLESNKNKRNIKTNPVQEDNKDLDNKTESQCYGAKTINKTTINDSDNNDNNNTMKNYFNTNDRIIKPFSNYSTNSYNYRKKKYPKINKINYPKPISIKMKERTNEFNTLDDDKTDMSFSNDMNLEPKKIINKKKEKLDKSFDIAQKEITPFTKKILNKNKENPKIYISKKISDKNGEQKIIDYERNTIGCPNISNNNKIYNDFINAQNNKSTSKAYVKKTPDTSKVVSNNNTIDDNADNPKNSFYKNKKHLNKTLMKPTQNITTIEADYHNKTSLNQDTSNNKKVDTISTDYGTNKISKIKKMKDNRQQNKIEIIFNLEDLMILEERLNDIILALESNDNIANKCFNYWNYYYNCSLSNLIEKIFKNKEDSDIVRLSFNYELISIMVCYEYSFEIDSLSKQIFYLLIELIELNHSNLMIICEYILSKIDPENKQNIWVLKLQQIIKGSKPFQSIGDKNKYPKNTIKAIDLNASLLITKLRYILQKYPTQYSEIYFSLISNLDTFSYEEINNFFRKYILRVDNFEGSIVASSYLKKKKYYEPFSPPYLTYPSPKPYTLVLDLDETLVHFKIKSNKGGTLRARPYLFSFLEEMGHYYELIIWTSATEKYANSLIDAIESEKKYFDYILFREHAIIIDNDFVKDLTRIGRNLDRIIMIDDMPQNYRLQKENGINIKPFFGDDMDDTALYDLIPILKHIAESGKDARVELNKYREEIVKKVTSNISKK